MKPAAHMFKPLLCFSVGATALQCNIKGLVHCALDLQPLLIPCFQRPASVCWTLTHRAVQYKWACSAQLPHHKQAWWKNITSMPATTHQGVNLCSLSSTEAWRWSTVSYTHHAWTAFPGWLFPAQDYPSAAGHSCLARDSVDHEQAWHFLSLTKHFLLSSLIFLFSLYL